MKVDITQPAFGDDGMIIPNSFKVTLTPPKHVKLSDTAILKVTLVDKKGMETTVTRPIKYSTVAAVTSTAGNLSSVATDVELAVLVIKAVWMLPTLPIFAIPLPNSRCLTSP